MPLICEGCKQLVADDQIPQSLRTIYLDTVHLYSGDSPIKKCKGCGSHIEARLMTNPFQVKKSIPTTLSSGYYKEMHKDYLHGEGLSG